MRRRIGIDLDGVLIDHTASKIAAAERLGFAFESWQVNANLLRSVMPPDDHDTLVEQVSTVMTVSAPVVPGALEHLAELDAELYVVSVRKLKTVRFAQQWLLRYGVFDLVPAERMFFVEAIKDKRAVCDRLGITAFVDDRVDALRVLSPRMTRVLLDRDGVSPRLDLDQGFEVAQDWAQARTLVEAR